MFIPNVVLRAKAGDVDSGGGDNGDQTDVTAIVNSAVTSQLKRLLPKAIGEAIGGLKLDEQIAVAIEKLKPAPEQEPEKKGESEIEKRLAALTSKLEAETKARREAEQRSVEADEKRRFDGAKVALRNSLQPKVKPELLDVLTDNLALSGRLKLTDEGATLRVKHSPYKGEPESDLDLPLADAVTAFLASNESKPFLPAPGGQPVGGAPQNKVVRTMQVVNADVKGEVDKASAVLAALQAQGIDPSVL